MSAKELRKNLNRTQATEVTVRFDQVEELIGEEEAFKLALAASSVNQKPMRNRRGQRVRGESLGLATYNRQELIDAIDAASKGRSGASQSSFGRPSSAKPAEKGSPGSSEGFVPSNRTES